MYRTVTAIFNNHREAGMAIDRLLAHDFPQDNISMLVAEGQGTEHFGARVKSKTAERVAAGATVGGTLGAIGASLAAMTTWTLPDVGLLAAGPLVVAAVGLIAGGLIGGLIGLGIPEHEATLFISEGVEKAGILVGVKVKNRRADLAKELLQDGDATNVVVH